MPNVHHITVTMRGPRDIAIDVPGACQVRCLGPDAFSRAARLFCEVEGGEDWPETAGLVTKDCTEKDKGQVQPGRQAMPTAGSLVRERWSLHARSSAMRCAREQQVRDQGESLIARGGAVTHGGRASVHSEGPNGANRRAL